MTAPAVRHQFQETLRELEEHTLSAMDIVVTQLDRALESLSYQDVELAGMVVADDDRIDGRYLEVHQGILSLLARQAPVAGDLRVVAALLHTLRCIERMGDQCVNIAKLVPLSGYEAPKDKDILDAIERMGQRARQLRDADDRSGSACYLVAGPYRWLILALTAGAINAAFVLAVIGR